VKIIVIVQLLGMIGLIMSASRLDAVLSADVDRFLITPLQDVSPKANNVRQASIIILRLDNVRLNARQIPHITPYLKHVFRQLTKPVLMTNSLIVKHLHVLKNVCSLIIKYLTLQLQSVTANKDTHQ
jgi:hypothetical protein